MASARTTDRYRAGRARTHDVPPADILGSVWQHTGLFFVGRVQRDGSARLVRFPRKRKLRTKQSAGNTPLPFRGGAGGGAHPRTRRMGKSPTPTPKWGRTRRRAYQIPLPLAGGVRGGADVRTGVRLMIPTPPPTPPASGRGAKECRPPASPGVTHPFVLSSGRVAPSGAHRGRVSKHRPRAPTHPYIRSAAPQDERASRVAKPARLSAPTAGYRARRPARA